jgi:hypothetical protein
MTIPLAIVLIVLLAAIVAGTREAIVFYRWTLLLRRVRAEHEAQAYAGRVDTHLRRFRQS